MINSITRR